MDFPRRVGNPAAIGSTHPPARATADLIITLDTRRSTGAPAGRLGLAPSPAVQANVCLAIRVHAPGEPGRQGAPPGRPYPRRSL